MTKSGLVHYVCIADAHVSGGRRSASDTLTVVSGRWAYCGFNTQGDGHEWRATEGVTIEVLRSGLPRRLAALPAENRGR